MLSTGTSLDWTMVDVAVPRPTVRLPGVTMAGFRQRSTAFAEIAMVAHPGVTLLVNLADSAGVAYDQRGRRESGSVVIGLLPADLRASCDGVECLQIRFEPTVAGAVLGAAGDLTGALVSFRDVWGRDASRFEDRLRAAASWDERFGIATEVLGRRLDARRPVDPEVAHIWRRTLAGRGRLRIDDLAGEVGWSRQRLWSRFSAQLGITPKRAARLVRFDRAVHLLAAGHPPAEVASASGYVDQSHLHREVREFAASTPTAVAAAPWLAIDDVAWPTGSRSRATGPAAVRRRAG